MLKIENVWTANEVLRWTFLFLKVPDLHLFVFIKKLVITELHFLVILFRFKVLTVNKGERGEH